MPYADPVKAKEYKSEWYQQNEKGNPAFLQKKRERYIKYKVSISKDTAEYRLKNRATIRKRQNKHYKDTNGASNKAYIQRDYVKASRAEWNSRSRIQKIRTSKFELNNKGNTLKVFKLSRKKTKETGRDYHVDHIVPLQGRLVSGFHVSGNLRVILADTNLSKHNHYIARDESLIQRRMIKTWKANGVKFKLNKPKKGAKCIL
jgi:hypothetical protein